MMSHGHRPLLIVLLLLLVFSGGVRTQEDKSWADVPLWRENFKQFMDMGRKAVDDFNQVDKLLQFDKFVFCRTEKVKKQTVEKDVFYALTLLAGQRACNSLFSLTCFVDFRGYEAVVVHRHSEHGFKLRSFIFLPEYSLKYDKKCI
ncbi:hypothetical protein AXF42_Ash015780 [Apostasia shenzhenica]|uniref:Cystatin domain-containing protein n=1 Tax=Apostasia shenzhenica TaxID=1088818 RepID=A0A2H9ZXL9_9ASPA|nr:hypothetical protein AXF42_Ash015779 [Apostasia shenzhenica]PKA48017.1 hypothetical protein AXF42_Ash015780 [Apostasia shenzhenica]